MSGKIIDLSNRLEQKQKENAAWAAYDEHKASGCSECGKYDGRPLCVKGTELAEAILVATHLPKLRHSRPSAQRRHSS